MIDQLSVIGFFCIKNQHWLNEGEIIAKKKPVTRSARPSTKKKRVARKVGMKARTTLNISVSKREAEVDRILDKASAEGIGNLTEVEREI